MGTHPIFESDFDCLTEMKLLSVLISLCFASQWSIVRQPESVKLGDGGIDAQELLSIQNIITGQAPAQTLDTKVLESFNAFKPVEKAVILIVPGLTGQYLSGEVAAPSIELNYPSDAQAVVDTDDKVTVLSATSNVEDRVKELLKSLEAKHGDNFMLTLVSHTGDDFVSGRQILQDDSAGFIYSTEPRNADFGIIFIIVAAFIIAMIFGLVFISYELVNMGPGDNIAYKLGAAATKKNQ